MSKFLVCFGTEGLEAVVNITKIVDRDIVNKLCQEENSKNTNLELSKILFFLKFRFRCNSHRRIKSYLLEYDGQEQDIWDHEKFIIKKLKREGKPINI